jgi:anhydro-N-acetylmuramic acid kinase
VRVAGIMSGTSLDGIDVAIVDVSGRGWNKKIRTVAFQATPYPGRVRKALLDVSNTSAHTGDVARIHFLLAELYAEAFRAACQAGGIAPDTVMLIGCHGQTIFHQGTAAKFLGRSVACTLQLGDGSVLAERTGIPVVSDFRTRDVAAGGRGAPLVPYVDYLLYRHPSRGRLALNLGGIANVTVIPASAQPEQVLAFDTGPASMAIDGLMTQYTQGRRNFDRNGAAAAKGHDNAALLTELLADPFYRQKPPKSAGREQYGREFVARLLAANLGSADTLATATALTAKSIALAVEQFCLPLGRMDEMIVSGGGVHNATLMRMVQRELISIDVISSARLGVDPDAKEAVAFALLAYETWHKRPSNLPSATGARRAVILGKISPR